MKKLLLSTALVLASCALSSAQDVRLLYWNIQNGMWADQDNNFDNFVNYVNEVKPDICVWCEAKTIYDKQKKKLKISDWYLPNNWDVVARRYGHSYVYVGGWRDDYPQVITSRFPIENVQRFLGEKPDKVISHGSGWARLNISGKEVNIVTVHTWPQRFRRGIDKNDKQAVKESSARKEGDDYRAMEVEYICDNTIHKSKNPDKEYWMMLGDFNSISPVDNHYYGYPSDTCAFKCQNYMLDHTPYIDVIGTVHKGKFISSEASKRRIDYVYTSKALFDCVKDAKIDWNEYTTPVKAEFKYFYYPSNHLPIIVDFKL